MTIQFIYHIGESRINSPFDKAIRELATKKDIAIVCPYIGIKYFEEILALCNNWRLLTDVSAWLDSYHRNPEQLLQIKKFIDKHVDHIHHYHNIHAKVIISQDVALVGSANLTNQGIQSRQEMSVLIQDKDQIKELYKWFHRLWEDTDCLNEQEIINIASYIKDNSRFKKAKISNDIFLDLRMPKSASELPKDIKGEKFGNSHLITIKHLTTLIANEEERIQWDSIRRWIYYMINHGKIRAYRYRGIQLLDDDGAKEIWQFRFRIRDGEKNRDISKTKNIIELPNNQWLTIQEVALQTGKSVGKIRRMIEDRIIQPKFHDKLFVFDFSVIDVIKSLLPEPSGRREQAKVNQMDIKRLYPFTPLEKFILEARDKEPSLSDQQLIDKAREAGLTASHNRERARQIFGKAVTKKGLFKQLNIKPEALEKTGYISIAKTKAGRPRKIVDSIIP